MPLARDQRIRLARVMSWSRSHGWKHDVYPNTWRSHDGDTHIRFDAGEDELVIDRLTRGETPLRCRVAIVPVDSPDLALDVLAALGHIPTALAPGHELAGVSAEVTLPGPEALAQLWHDEQCPNRGSSSCWCCCEDCDPAWDGANPHHAAATLALRERFPADATDPVLPVDDGAQDTFDGPASFIEAGQAFADAVDGRVSADRAAEVLSGLAHNGLIISVAYHDEVVADRADLEEDLAAIIDGDPL